MEWYTELAKWVGWPAIVLFLITVGGVGIWIYDSRIKLKNEQIELLEKQLKDIENNTPEILLKRLVELKENLKKEVELKSSPSDEDTLKIIALQKELNEVNSQLNSQKEVLAEARQLLEDSALPRGGRFQLDIAEDIRQIIKNHQSIYIPFEIENPTDEVITNIKNNQPYKIETIFPGMSKMYLFVFDKEDKLIGSVYNPYIGYYHKDYYVTLLQLLQDFPYEHLGRSEGHEGDSMIFKKSEFFGIDQFKPNIMYIKVPIE